MKTALDIAASSDQPLSQTHPAVSTGLALCRHVMDDLMDRDLLGVLLSSSHTRMYLAIFSTYAAPEFAAMIKRDIQNVEVVDFFHKHMLKMFSGIYIAEAEIKDRAELFKILDDKCESLARQVNSDDVRYETSLQQLASVELAWKYRSACISGRPIAYV